MADSISLPAVPALLCDLDDRVLRVNPAFLDLAGRCPDDAGAADGLIGRRVPQLVAGDRVDVRLSRPDGTEVRVRPIRWELPEAGLRVVVLVDITDVGPAEPAVRAGQGYWQPELLRLANVGDWSYDLTSDTLDRGAALTDLYRALGLPIDATADAVSTGAELAELRQVAMIRGELHSGAPVDEHHVEHRTPAPSHRVFSCRAHVERAADGTPQRLVGIVQDITEQRLAEDRVRRSSQRFTDLVSMSPLGVGVFDPAGRLVDANAALCALLGEPLEALRGRCASDITGSHQVPADWLRPVPPGGAHSYQVDALPVQRAAGEPAWCELSVTVSIGDDGRRFWLVGFNDVSARRAAAAGVSSGVPQPGVAAGGRPGKLPVTATLDELTGLPNRVATTQLICHLLGGGSPGVAVLCAGLDDLHRVNESLGHDAGDQLRVTVAELLRSELPAGCTVGRLSTDEFLVVCSDIGALGGLEALAERVCNLLRTTVTMHGQQVAVSASVGAAAPIEAGSSAADLLRLAEAAMCEAQKAGAGRVSLADEALMVRASEQLRMETELREAIITDQLVLHYQPVVGADGSVRSAEALVRWAHPARGLLGPAEFLPAAERAGLLRELDCWVLRAATRAAASWPEHRGGPVSVAINLAGLLPGDPEFVATVTAAVTEARLPWSRLVLELVETSLVELPPSTLAVMDELVDRGVRFAVDDFGTGYSSLARLKTLPTQIVKVDRSFVAGVSRDPADFALARAVVEVAKAMGRRCVAEGVETPDQFHVLRGIGVDWYQGWLFAKAVDGPALREMIAGDRLAIPPG